MTEEIEKALEVWTLQNLLNISIMLGILATGLALSHGYYRALEKRLSLRVSIELWNVLTALAVDLILGAVVLVGYLVLNPDIMADIKIALPFCPVATLLYAVALGLRLFHDGHETTSKNYLRAVYLMIVASLVNMVGFTYVMEAPSKDYLALHPSPFWQFLKTRLRSNGGPDGLELSQLTFNICFPLLLLIFFWGVASALRQLKNREGE